MSILDCGHPDTDPTTYHTQHEPRCWGIGWGGHCGCPHVCATCCSCCEEGET